MATMSDLRTEVAKLYRKARRSEIPIEDASRLVAILRVLSEIIRDTNLEQRMAELEGKARPQRHSATSSGLCDGWIRHSQRAIAAIGAS